MKSDEAQNVLGNLELAKRREQVRTKAPVFDSRHSPAFPRGHHYYSLVELLVSHRAPPKVADRGRLTRFGGYWGNKITRVDQNQLHCFVEKGDLQRLGEETPKENQLAQRLRWQPHHWDRVLHTLNTIIKETEMKSKRPDIWSDFFGMKLKTRIAFWSVRTLREYDKLKQIEKEMTSYKLDLSEIRWKENGEIETQNGNSLILSGVSEDREHRS